MGIAARDEMDALEAIGGDWKVVPDNHVVTVRGDGLDRRQFDEAVMRLKDEAFWEDRRLWGEIAQGLPNDRLSKFQALMPDWVQRELVASYLLDGEGARRWVAAAG